MELFRVCYMWRKYAGLLQSHIYGADKVKTVSAFENGRSSNLKHFEHYYGLAIAMNQKDVFDEFIQFEIDRSAKRASQKDDK